METLCFAVEGRQAPDFFRQHDNEDNADQTVETAKFIFKWGWLLAHIVAGLYTAFEGGIAGWDFQAAGGLIILLPVAVPLLIWFAVLVYRVAAVAQYRKHVEKMIADAVADNDHRKIIAAVGPR